jgi:predicted enzyme related to lactoylglutathione lyase
MSKVVHFEIHAKDQVKMQKFYEEAFGWKFTNMGPKMGNYLVIETGKKADIGIGGGMNSVPTHTVKDGEPINAFVSIIGVEDIVESVEKVKTAGGKVVEEIIDMPTVGKIAYCKDPEGNLFGIIEPVMPAEDKK